MTTPRKVGGDTKQFGNRGLGRPKGSPNKTTAGVKAALSAVYADLQAAVEGVDIGPNAHLKVWAMANPTEFYKLWGRMLPTEISGPDGAPIPLDVTDALAKLSPADRKKVRDIALKLEGN